MKLNYLKIKNEKVSKYEFVSNTIVDTLTSTGFYYVDGTCSELPLSNMSFYLTVIAHSGQKFIIQYATVVSNATSRNFQRKMYNGIWGLWSEYGMPQQTTILKNIDLNSIKIPGIYEHDGHENLNNSHVFGVFEVIDCGYYILQRVTNAIGIGIRISYDKGDTWSKWKYIKLQDSL